MSGRQLSLAQLVKNLRIIKLQDSLLVLGDLSDLELDAMIQKLVDEIQSGEEQRKFEEANQPTAQQQLQQINQNQNQGLQPTGSTWYFYNTSALSFGSNNFRQKWGDRKREDNWRRKSKRLNNITEFVDAEDETAPASTSELLDPSFYKKGIPRTDVEKDSAHVKIQNAFYDLGSIYKEQLSEEERAIQAFEELLQRYPDGVWNLETFYQLYRLYKATGDERKAQDYANRILREYPDSEYAKIIKDPKYLEKLEQLRSRLDDMYYMAFRNYNKGEYERVIEAADSALTKFQEGDILSKFALLKVMAVGATEKLIIYRQALESYIAKYTAAPEKERAEELLLYVKGLMGETVPDEVVEGKPKEEEQNDEYIFDFESMHYYALVASDLSDVVGLKSRISNFNSTLFSIETLTIKDLQFGADKKLLFVQGFKETKKAMDYYNAILADTTVFEDVDLNKTDQFIISQDNFTKFYKKKEIPSYVEFFITKYILKQKDD
ncbi:MAG: tetratricopeptide (TPR) repeat protein [Bacteroidia bacterium]